MRIIGCDLHARQQTLAMLDTTTGEVVNMTLKHEGNNLFLASTPGASGHRSHGIDAMVCEPHGGAGNRMLGRSSGRDSGSRATEAETYRRDADLILKLLAENRFPARSYRICGPWYGTVISG